MHKTAEHLSRAVYFHGLAVTATLLFPTSSRSHCPVFSTNVTGKREAPSGPRAQGGAKTPFSAFTALNKLPEPTDQGIDANMSRITNLVAVGRVVAIPLAQLDPSAWEYIFQASKTIWTINSNCHSIPARDGTKFVLSGSNLWKIRNIWVLIRTISVTRQYENDHWATQLAP